MEGDWVVAEIDGYTGYLSAAYVEMDETVQTGASGTASEGVPGTVTLDGVNFRSGPSMTAEVIATFAAGTPVTILGESGDWTTVSVNGQRGYIFSQYVSKNDASAATPTATPEPEPTLTPTAPTTGSTGGTGRTGNTGGGKTTTGGSTGSGTGGSSQSSSGGEIIVDDGGSSDGEITIEGEVTLEP